MKLIAGLGNPGARYRNTRHNLGFDVLDALAARHGAGFDREKHSGLLAEIRLGREKVLLLKPQTFMNASGGCVAAVARNTAPEAEDVLVVVDDVNLSLGRLRFREGGSAGGHNGLKSIIERLGTPGFHRLRIGVGDTRNGKDLAGHVLSTFRPEEYALVRKMVEVSVAAAEHWAASGIESAMAQYNGYLAEE
ncbi:MAG: aminoacyl-tRNA hydrolase [Candidatus Hydrogenedentes bacterium]|nr:aminoacyl-tRNA hydrolase [Candidatus Hydrogenedentota bacterium]